MIDWNVIPKEIVAIGAHSDFSGGGFYMLDKRDGLTRYDGEDWSVDVLLDVRPDAVISVVNSLLYKIKRLEHELYTSKEASND